MAGTGRQEHGHLAGTGRQEHGHLAGTENRDWIDHLVRQDRKGVGVDLFEKMEGGGEGNMERTQNRILTSGFGKIKTLFDIC